MRRVFAAALCVLGAGVFTTGCESEDLSEIDDPIDEAGLAAGKADGPLTDCELDAIVALANDARTDFRAIGVTSTASKRILAHRDGNDARPGTADDDRFDDIAELDAVPYVGAGTFRRFAAAIAGRCNTPAGGPEASVVFSPQLADQSHLIEVARQIDRAQRGVDIAMYSYGSAGVADALKRARGRGVTIRFIFETANEDRKNPVGTASATIEAMGIDVRYVNTIMHHKFAIIDALPDPAAATLITGSANWSNSAATRFDENTLILRKNPEAVLRFQREFNTLWAGSRDFTVGTAALPTESPALPDQLPDDSAYDALFTSANFELKTVRGNPTFSDIPGKNTVADRLVQMIGDATRSIHLASGHLRSRPVAEALLAAKAARPDLDIRVYLDAQEYLSKSTHDGQVADREACLAAATTDAARQDCNDRGFLFSYQVQAAGIALKYKYYAYRWDHSYADQMHHKYMVVDGKLLITGSYNLSDNAEHQTMENMSVFSGTAYAPLIRQYEANFEQMWKTGEAESLYAKLLDRVRTGALPIPIVFAPMALDWNQVNALKSAISTRCPNVNSTEYRTNAAAHRVCQ